MIDIPERWTPRWKSTAQSRAVCWEIVRTDGETFRFTSWDQPIFIGPRKFLPRDEGSESGGGQFSGESRQSSMKEHAVGMSGVISSSSFTEHDLRSGLFESATVTIYEVDARQPSAGSVSRTFKVADTKWTTDGRWSFSLVSDIDTSLQRKRGEVVSRTCRNTLFAGRCARTRTPGGSDGLVADEWEVGQTSGNYCTVSEVVNAYTFKVQIPAMTISAIGTSTGDDQTTLTFTGNHYFCGESPIGGRPLHVPMLVYGNVGSVPGINGEWPTVVTAPGAPDTSVTITGVDVSVAGTTKGFACLAPEISWFDRGHVVWAAGDNLGTIAVVSESGAFVADPVSGFGGYVTIELDAAPPRSIQVGDTCTLIAGCDRSIVACESKFENLVNFNGEPYTPSSDVILYSPSSK